MKKKIIFSLVLISILLIGCNSKSNEINELTSDDEGFSIIMSGQYEKDTIIRNGLEFNDYNSISNGVIFQVTPTFIYPPEESFKVSNEDINEIINNISKEEEIIYNKEYSLEGAYCREIKTKNLIIYTKSLHCYANGYFYDIIAITLGKKIDNELVTNFFNSFKVFKPRPKVFPDQDDEDLELRNIPERSFEIEELKTFLSSMESNINFRPTKDRNDFESLIISDDRSRTWIIQQLTDEGYHLRNMNDFFFLVDNSRWEIWNEYLTNIKFRLLQPEFTEVELGNYFQKDYYNFKQYQLESRKIEQDVSEDLINVNAGNIPEFLMSHMEVDFSGNYKFNYLEPIIVYKIPCTKDLIIYHRQRDTYFDSFTSKGNEKNSVIDNWKHYINSNRHDTIAKINQVLDFCGLTEFDYDYSKYEPLDKTTKNVKNPRMFFRFGYNHTLDIKVNKEKVSEKGYHINDLEFTFTSNDDILDDIDRINEIYMYIYIQNGEQKITLVNDLYKSRLKKGNKITKTIEIDQTFTGDELYLLAWPYLKEPDSPDFRSGEDEPIYYLVGPRSGYAPISE